jgi:phage regulator Rha-like protein
VTSKRGQHRKYLPWAFTEHGAIMAANVLNSTRAAQMSVFVVRAFVKMRSALTDTRALARKLAALEKELKDRLDVHEAAIVTILQRVMDLIDPPPQPEPPPKQIGFQVKEGRGRYRIERKKACG